MEDSALVIIDFTMGSHRTTGVAAKNLNRKFIGLKKTKNILKLLVKE